MKIILLVALATGLLITSTACDTRIPPDPEIPPTLQLETTPEPEEEPLDEPEEQEHEAELPIEPEKVANSGLRPGLQNALDNGSKLVAITFDDGPYEPHTPEMLQILREEDIKATFFLVGRNVNLFPELAKQIAEDGHQLANHTYNHKILTKLEMEERRSEVQDNNDLIEQVTGVRPTAMRPTSGSLNAEVEAEMGMPIILWSVDPRDWDVKDADTVYSHVVEKTTDGDIIILHDVYESSVEAAARIIPALKKKGFFFVTVDELIGLRGEFVNGRVYKSLPPLPELEEEAPEKTKVEGAEESVAGPEAVIVDNEALAEPVEDQQPE